MSDSESTPGSDKNPKTDHTPTHAIQEASNSPTTADLTVVETSDSRSERISNGLSAYRTPLETLADKPGSMRAGINAMCYECQGGDWADAGWQWGVGNCRLKTCPNWNMRPYQHKAGTPGEGVYKQHYGELQGSAGV